MKRIFALYFFIGLSFVLNSQTADTTTKFTADTLTKLQDTIPSFDSTKLASEIFFTDTSVSDRDLIRKPENQVVRKIDTSSQNILLIGDSMVGGLAYALQEYCDYNGHKFTAVAWESAQTKWFAKTDTLNFFIKKYHPNLVLILLGANEVYLSDNYEEKRGKYIDEIVSQLDSVPFLWIGPPNWNSDTALNSVICKHVGADRFFYSYKVSLNNPQFKRWRDGIHPALSADRLWADSLSKWIMQKSRYPVKLYKPATYPEKARANLIILHPLTRRQRSAL